MTPEMIVVVGIVTLLLGAVMLLTSLTAYCIEPPFLWPSLFVVFLGAILIIVGFVNGADPGQILPTALAMWGWTP
jgi:hypothetical protein